MMRPTESDAAMATDQQPELRVGEYPEPRDDRPRPESLAEQRGQNWALPDRARGSIPITRPVRLRCADDQLTILSDRRGVQARVVPLEGDTTEAIDEFRSALWEHMDDWGIAGRGMHWKPVLSIDVVPGGEDRFADLEALLDGSGLAVERRGASAGTRRSRR
jgi:hypothetical protein